VERVSVVKVASTLTWDFTLERNVSSVNCVARVFQNKDILRLTPVFAQEKEWFKCSSENAVLL